jgi:hypothetical protein
MATAAEYRQLAEECFKWAREAFDESVRQQYASLGRVWLECAARAEVQSREVTSPEIRNGGASGPFTVGRNSSGNLTIFAAIRRASSLLSILAATAPRIPVCRKKPDQVAGLFSVLAPLGGRDLVQLAKVGGWICNFVADVCCRCDRVILRIQKRLNLACLNVVFLYLIK